MTPQDKAKELVSKFTFLSYPESNMKFYNPKQCALIAVDEIIDQWEYIDTYIADLGGKLNLNLHFWQQVKQEIEKL
jgi:hypothetical protein